MFQITFKAQGHTYKTLTMSKTEMETYVNSGRASRVANSLGAAVGRPINYYVQTKR